MAAEPTKAIYVRVPAAVADKLDRVSERLGMSKRDIVTRLVGDRIEMGDGVQPIRLWAEDESRRSGVQHDDVLSLDEAAALLRVEPADVREMAEAGELPARKLGQQWRFSRTALLTWLRAE
jgi:excisionase family DNA binding protein